MKKYVDGKYVELTAKEVKAIEEENKKLESVPTPEERIEQLENEVAELKAIIEGGDVNV